MMQTKQLFLVSFAATLLPIITAQCVYNQTHCNCAVSSAPGVCARFAVGTPGNATCVVDNCIAGNYNCDCSGTEMCELSTCDSWKFEDPLTATTVGAMETCFFVSRFSPIAAQCVSLVV